MALQKRMPAVPGIPPAPIFKDFLDDADREFEKKKKLYAHNLPFMTGVEVVETHDAYHVNILHSLLVDGYYRVVQEINSISKKEELERKMIKHARFMNPLPLVDQKPKLLYVLEILKYCQDYHQYEDNYKIAALRKECAETLLRDGDVWLAKYFFDSSLKTTEIISSEGQRHKNQMIAELRCLIAFVVQQTEENAETAYNIAMDHLTACRELSNEKAWLLKSGLLTIKIKKPITLHGLREEYEIIDGNSMILYNIATLLEHEMLLSVANHIVHHKAIAHPGHPLTEAVDAADVFLSASLQLAYLVRQPTALISSLLRYGTVLRHAGEFDKAIKYFEQFIAQAEHNSDPESIAIGYNELGICYHGKLDVITALEYFIQEKEIGEEYGIDEIEADAMQQIAHILLQEGHLWESEECYFQAYRSFDKFLHKNDEIEAEEEEETEDIEAIEEADPAESHRKSEEYPDSEEDETEKAENENGESDSDSDDDDEDDYDLDEEVDESDEHKRKRLTIELQQYIKEKPKTLPTSYYAEKDFIFTAIGAGEKLWSQYAGLLMEKNIKILEHVIEWKNRRHELPTVPRPNYDVDIIEDIYSNTIATTITTVANENEPSPVSPDSNKTDRAEGEDGDEGEGRFDDENRTIGKFKIPKKTKISDATKLKAELKELELKKRNRELRMKSMFIRRENRIQEASGNQIDDEKLFLKPEEAQAGEEEWNKVVAQAGEEILEEERRKSLIVAVQETRKSIEIKNAAPQERRKSSQKLSQSAHE